MDGPEAAQGREGALHRHRRAGLAAVALPGRGGRRHARPGRFRRRRRLQPPAADHPRHRRRRPAQDRQRRGEAQGDQPRRDRPPPRASVDSSNALEIFADYDVIVDGTDNFPTRYLVNDACVLLGKPNVYGSIFRFDGQATVFFPPHGPCYRCLYPEPPPPGVVPNCAEGGVLGILPGLIGVVQATETVKLILGRGHAADRPAAALRRAGDDLPRVEGPQEPASARSAGRTRRSRELIDYEEFCGVRGAEAPPASDGDPRRDHAARAQGADRPRASGRSSSTCATPRRSRSAGSPAAR